MSDKAHAQENKGQTVDLAGTKPFETNHRTRSWIFFVCSAPSGRTILPIRSDNHNFDLWNFGSFRRFLLSNIFGKIENNAQMWWEWFPSPYSCWFPSWRSSSPSLYGTQGELQTSGETLNHFMNRLWSGNGGNPRDAIDPKTNSQRHPKRSKTTRSVEVLTENVVMVTVWKISRKTQKSSDRQV